jgi:dihydrofolate reductase
MAAAEGSTESDVAMGKVILDVSMSLDGFIAGPDRSLDLPLGEGGLERWARDVASYREEHGNTGATVVGRRMFSGGDGAWEDDPNADGWWGDDPPFHHPLLILTHHAREPVALKDGTTFTFVTDGIESALEQARAVVGDKDIAVCGGASIAQQYLSAGLVEELQLHVLPVLLGQGLRLFENHIGGEPGVLEPIRVVESSAGVVHLRYRVTSQASQRTER